jgi:YidC/Oxa1 family membrane protein insertase
MKRVLAMKIVTQSFILSIRMESDYLGLGTEADIVNDVSYIAYKQHFFCSILLTDVPFAKAELFSNNLVKDDATDTIFTNNLKRLFL